MRKTKKFAAILLSALILSSSFSVLPVNAATIERNNQVVSSDQVIKQIISCILSLIMKISRLKIYR